MNDQPVQQAILDDAKSFVEAEIRPYAGQFDREEKMSPELIRKMGEKREGNPILESHG